MDSVPTKQYEERYPEDNPSTTVYVVIPFLYPVPKWSVYQVTLCWTPGQGNYRRDSLPDFLSEESGLQIKISSAKTIIICSRSTQLKSFDFI